MTETSPATENSTAHGETFSFRERLGEMYAKSPLNKDDRMFNLGLYVRSSLLVKFLVLDDLYRRFKTWYCSRISGPSMSRSTNSERLSVLTLSAAIPKTRGWQRNRSRPTAVITLEWTTKRILQSYWRFTRATMRLAISGVTTS